jgi:dTDP-4-dehydrorhamnose reductase
MKILVTGAKGQLGSEIRDLSDNLKGGTFIFTDTDLDITDPKALDSYFGENRTDIVINCAAYTAVDRAEKERKAAYLLNEKACSHLAGLSKKYGFRLLHISTDFVFDGKKSTPYIETDKTGPVSIYGMTKLGGEKELISKASSYIIIRTSWLYSSYGNNFVKTILRVSGEKDELRVVYDQTGSPTYARDLAGAIIKIIPQFKHGTREIYHYSNEGIASWYDFAKSICEFAQVNTPVLPVETADYPTAARRPAYSVLSKKKIKSDFNLRIPYWRDSLKECLSLMR